MSTTTGKKKGGGFLTRQAKSKDKALDSMSEEELLKKSTISPEEVLRLNKITERQYKYNGLFFGYGRVKKKLTDGNNQLLFRVRPISYCLLLYDYPCVVKQCSSMYPLFLFPGFDD